MSFYSGRGSVEHPTQRAGFGELTVAENLPFIQASAEYDFVPSNFRTFTSGTGSATTESKMFKTSTGAGVGGYGAIQSFRSINYKAGQGGLARFTGLFESNVASSWQGVGLISIGDEIGFGYNGTSFGVWHRYGGLAEVRTLTVTGAAGGSENLTLTLNGTGYTIPLTSGTVEHNAYEIAAWLNDTANQSVWVADQLDDTVIISAQSDGAKAGSYSFSSSTATGSIAQDIAGVTKTSDFVAQASWNGRPCDWLDPTKGNVFQIQYQYLGFGDIRYYVEDPETGEFELAHTIEYANNNTVPNLGNPGLRLGMYCVSLGSTTDLIVRSGSFAGFTQGVRQKTRNPRAFANTQTVSTSMTNIMTIRNRRTYNGYFNQIEIEPIFLTVASESGKNVSVELRATSDVGVEQNFTNVGTNLISDVDTTAATGITNGRLLTAFVVAGNSTITIPLADFLIRLPPSLNLVIQGAVTSGANSSVSAALTWYEDI